jgi:hypothetical protein
LAYALAAGFRSGHRFLDYSKRCCTAKAFRLFPVLNSSNCGLAGENFVGSYKKGTQEMSIFHELWAYFRARKKFWLLPIFVMMIILGGLVILSQGSPLAPFIYTIF